MLAADGQDLVLDIAFPDRIFALQRGDRRGLGGTAQRFGPGFRKRDVADLALLHQLHHPADGFLDRHRRIDAVLVEEVDRRSEEHTSELQSLIRHSYAVFCLEKKKSQNSTSYSLHLLTHHLYVLNTTIFFSNIILSYALYT